MSTLEEHMIPDGFKTLILDLSNDLYETFPEFSGEFDKEGCNVYHFSLNKENSCPKRILDEYNNCCRVYREHFFNILYENEELFNTSNLYLLSNVDFNVLWNVEDLTDNTRKTLWKYIQLILFKVVENTHDMKDFGDSSAFFEVINDDALKAKMTEALEDIKNVFENMDDTNKECNDEDGGDKSNPKINEDNLPNVDELHEHLSGIFKGKIGRLAEEIMEETKEEWKDSFDIDIEAEGDGTDNEIKNINDVFSKLLKDPMKLISLIKRIGSKLEEKIKSGEVKESELLEETSELMKNMKNTPGMKDMEKVFKMFGASANGEDGKGGDKTTQGLSQMMSMLSGKKGKKNLNHIQSQMNSNIKSSKTRERMLRKLEENRKRNMDGKS